MTHPYIISLDLDGTLLTSKKTISRRTKQTLQKIRSQGHHIVISTGRPYRSSLMYYQELELDSPIISFNGSYVHHPLDSNFDTYHSTLDLSVTKEIFHSCQEIGMTNMFAEVLSGVYAHQSEHTYQQVSRFDYGNFYEENLLELKEEPTCLLVDSSDEDIDSIRRHLSNFHADTIEHKHVVEHRRSDTPWHVVEIIKSGNTKATGLQRVSSYYEIPRERIIAFGDEKNDLEAIEYAGHGIAMSNAIPQLKNIANNTTLSNEEDGVAVYLEKFLRC